MSSERKRQSMDNLDKCYKVIEQSSTGISAIDIAEKLKIHRTTVHGYLNSLELSGRVYSQKGLWYLQGASSKHSTDSLFLNRIFTKIDEIQEDLYGYFSNSEVALGKTRFLIAQLPEDLKKEMKIEEERVLEYLKKYDPDKGGEEWERYQGACVTATRHLVDRLTSLMNKSL